MGTAAEGGSMAACKKCAKRWTSDDDSAGCICAEGATGANCSECEAGYGGSNCARCKDNTASGGGGLKIKCTKCPAGTKPSGNHAECISQA